MCVFLYQQTQKNFPFYVSWDQHFLDIILKLGFGNMQMRPDSHAQLYIPP
jgi:hypothetical protein